MCQPPKTPLTFILYFEYASVIILAERRSMGLIGICVGFQYYRSIYIWPGVSTLLLLVSAWQKQVKEV
jgi:hypothetical protein